jgi:hypothetical protein
MLPLHGPHLPQTHEQFLQALQGGLGQLVTPSSRPLIQSAGEFSQYQQLHIDLSGSRLLRPDSLLLPDGSGQTEPGITVDEFRLVGKPLHFEQALFELEFIARDARFVFDRGPQGSPILVPVEATGMFHSRIPQASLASLLVSALEEAASKQGVTLDEIEPTLSHLGGGALQLRLRVKATKRIGFFPASGVFIITGRLDIDESLVARISALDCSGEGALGKLLSPLLGGKLQAFNGQSLSLAAFPLGQIRLRDLRISTPPRELQLQAEFGA